MGSRPNCVANFTSAPVGLSWKLGMTTPSSSPLPETFQGRPRYTRTALDVRVTVVPFATRSQIGSTYQTSGGAGRAELRTLIRVGSSPPSVESRLTGVV